MDTSVMPFRVGFEFQMDGKLCEWALDNYNVQKKPIFTVYNGDKKLYHVELDGPDIEFVTEHFSNTERSHLIECMKSIKSVIDLTKLTLDSSPITSFNNWFSILSGIESIQIKPTDFFDEIKEKTINKLNPDLPWVPRWQPQLTVQHPLNHTITLCKELFTDSKSMQAVIDKSTPKKIESNTALAGLMFLVAHEMSGISNSYLTPIHQTDSYLDLSLALAMYFHEQDLVAVDLVQASIKALSDPRLDDLLNNPSLRPFLAALFEEENVTLKLAILTDIEEKNNEFASIAFQAINNLQSFVNIVREDRLLQSAILIKDTFKSYRDVHQFDAKRWTNFMSRRPFSHMFTEVAEGKNHIVSDDFSMSALSNFGNFLFYFKENIHFADQLPNVFCLANYGQQFLDENKLPLDLSPLLSFFKPVFQDSVSLSNLLRNGIICTSMFDVMDTAINVDNIIITQNAKNLTQEMRTPEYTQVTLSSIEKPEQRHYLFITKEDSLIRIDTKILGKEGILLDCLSPPCILDKTDAMGRYRKGVYHSKYEPLSFGSAIVEFRNIQLIKKLKATANKNVLIDFLTDPNFIEEETLNIFDLICGLTNKL